MCLNWWLTFLFSSWVCRLWLKHPNYEYDKRWPNCFSRKYFNTKKKHFPLQKQEMSYYRYIASVYKSYWPELNRTLRSSSSPRHVPQPVPCRIMLIVKSFLRYFPTFQLELSAPALCHQPPSTMPTHTLLDEWQPDHSMRELCPCRDSWPSPTTRGAWSRQRGSQPLLPPTTLTLTTRCSATWDS